MTIQLFCYDICKRRSLQLRAAPLSPELLLYAVVSIERSLSVRETTLDNFRGEYIVRLCF